MITLTKPSKHQTRSNETTNRPIQTVETAGSLAMLYNDGLLTIGQYDEFISSNPFAVDYSLYSNYSDSSMAYDGGFLSDFSNAVATLGASNGISSGGFSSAGFSGGCSGASCGGFTSVC